MYSASGRSVIESTKGFLMAFTKHFSTSFSIKLGQSEAWVGVGVDKFITEKIRMIVVPAMGEDRAQVWPLRDGTF